MHRYIEGPLFFGLSQGLTYIGGLKLMKRLSRARLAMVIALTFGIGLNVMAHHGWADFDRTKTVELSGVIVESKCQNPREGEI